jgi:hypothetical protein
MGNEPPIPSVVNINCSTLFSNDVVHSAFTPIPNFGPSFNLLNGLQFIQHYPAPCFQGKNVGENKEHWYNCGTYIVGSQSVAPNGTILGYECYSITIQEIELAGPVNPYQAQTDFKIVQDSCSVAGDSACGFP